MESISFSLISMILIFSLVFYVGINNGTGAAAVVLIVSIPVYFGVVLVDKEIDFLTNRNEVVVTAKIAAGQYKNLRKGTGICYVSSLCKSVVVTDKEEILVKGDGLLPTNTALVMITKKGHGEERRYLCSENQNTCWEMIAGLKS